MSARNFSSGLRKGLPVFAALIGLVASIIAIGQFGREWLKSLPDTSYVATYPSELHDENFHMWQATLQDPGKYMSVASFSSFVAGANGGLYWAGWCIRLGACEKVDIVQDCDAVVKSFRSALQLARWRPDAYRPEPSSEWRAVAETCDRRDGELDWLRPMWMLVD